MVDSKKRRFRPVMSFGDINNGGLNAYIYLFKDPKDGRRYYGYNILSNITEQQLVLQKEYYKTVRAALDAALYDMKTIKYSATDMVDAMENALQRDVAARYLYLQSDVNKDEC